MPLPLPAAQRIAANGPNMKAVQEGMVGTIYGSHGTARAIGVGAPYLIAGKTGTAQRVSRKGNVSVNPHQLPLHLRHRALFIGYAPADNPSIAVVVVVEHGGFGASTAAPIARKIMDAWLLPKIAPAPAPASAPAPLRAPASATATEIVR